MSRKDVFISATSGDLGSYREVAKQALLDIGAHPIEQKNFPTTHRELEQMLGELLDPCDAVLHIAGFRYGREPEHRPPDQPRHSYTQWEYYRAFEAQPPKPIYVFLASEACSFDSSEPEDEERQRLQREHRERLKKSERIYYEFSSKDELRSLIHRCDELRALVGPRFAHLPFLPLDEKFTGRRAILELLEKELGAHSVTGLPQPRVIHADGGVGKTALAIELGWRLYQSGRYGFVLFLNAEALDSELAALCSERVFGLPEREAREHAVRRDAMLDWLTNANNAKNTLLILDNADSPEAREAVRALLPQVSQCAVLITSRHAAWGKVRGYELDLFTPEEAHDYLATHLDPALLASPNAEEALNGIARVVDHLPLALELVVGYLHETRQTPDHWLAEWHRTPAATLEYHDPDAVNYPVSLSRVWDKSVARLSPRALAFLAVFASQAPRPFGFPLDPLQKQENWLEIRPAIAELAKASLISWPAGKDEVSMHRVLQTILLSHMSLEERSESLEFVLMILDASVPTPEYDEAGWRLWERLEPHIQMFLRHIRAIPFAGDAHILICQYAEWLYYRAQYADAELLNRWALALAEERFGTEDPELAPVLNGLSVVLVAQNRLHEAEDICKRAIAILEKTSGESPLAAYFYNTLAEILRFTSRVAEAEQPLRNALSLFANNFGAEDPKTVACIHNLATLLAATGRREEATELLHRELSIWEKRLGPMHPQVATCLNELGELARSAQRFDEAEKSFRRALQILEKSYDGDHPHIASCLNNLALTLGALNKSDEALELFFKALAMDVRIFGPEDPKISNRLNNLAWLLRRNGELAEAEPLYRQSIEILLKFESRTGHKHTTWERTFTDYLGLLQEMGETEETMSKRYADIIAKVNSEIAKTLSEN